jgi:dihydroxy-acid dehydratase
MCLLCVTHLKGATYGIMIGHVTPEAQVGGPLAAIREGDRISIDLQSQTIDVKLSPQQIQERLRSWKAPQTKYDSGVLGKYSKVRNIHLMYKN